MEIKVDKVNGIIKNLAKYEYYDEIGNKIAVLDEEQLKHLLNVDKVVFKEE